ncbi:thermonuclease family protein [Candidatus Pseudothioglobus singularis]|nr:thermonuclease family protein [Candidatus Pseudothioglobus singularis]
MKKLFLLLALTFISAQGYAGSCPDGSEPVKSVSEDGSYYEFKCADNKHSSNTLGIDTYGDIFSLNGGTVSIPEKVNPNYQTLRYFLYKYLYYAPNCCDRFHTVKASNPYNFQFDLREDPYIKQQMQETALLSYLLYEDDKIVIDEITPKDRFGDMFTDTSIYHSRSMGKTFTSYLTGHAICEGEIKSVDSRLDDWPILEGTLYHNQKLINLLNMSAGDSAYIKNDKFINPKGLNAFNDSSLQMTMKNEFKGSKKSFAQYSYNDANPNIVLSYLWYKYSEDDFKRLLDDVFAKKIRIGDEIFFNKTGRARKYEKSLMHTFYTTRYDYLRIAKAMLDDWQNDTCVGKYLKTIHERRIPKNGAQGTTGRVGMPLSYGGFFHTGYKGMENRPVMSMDGYGGQTITIDFERGRIVVTQAIHDNMEYPKPGSFDWKKIVYERIKNGKPASSSKVKESAESVIDSQQLILENEIRRENERKAKSYWDDFYIKAFNGGSDIVVFGSSTIGDDKVVPQNPYADETTTVGTKAKEKKAKETREVETLDTDPTISEVIEVSNADKFIVNIAEPHELAGSNIKIGLKDIDAPDAIKSCPKQMEFGIEVRDYVSQKLENASSIKLTNYRKTNTKIIAQVIVDGIDLGDELVSKGYASREFGYWKPYFCNPYTAFGIGNQYRDIDPKIAIFWYERAMELQVLGSLQSGIAMQLYGMYYDSDKEKSLEYLKKAATLGSIYGMEQLGSDYLYGNGVEKDINQGKQWLKKAFDNGSSEAEGIYCGSLSKEKQKTCKF